MAPNGPGTPSGSQDIVAPALVFIIGLATILAAWAFQIIGGFLPCALCLQERIPYYVGVPLALVALVSAIANGPVWLTRIALALAGIAFAYGVYLGVFHTGVEYAWWAGPADCGVASGPVTGTSGNLLEQIENIRVVSCSEASWRFPDGWGPSFAGWNALISILLAAVAFAGLVRSAKRA